MFQSERTVLYQNAVKFLLQDRPIRNFLCCLLVVKGLYWRQPTSERSFRVSCLRICKTGKSESWKQESTEILNLYFYFSPIISDLRLRQRGIDT